MGCRAALLEHLLFLLGLLRGLLHFALQLHLQQLGIVLRFQICQRLCALLLDLFDHDGQRRLLGCCCMALICSSVSLTERGSIRLLRRYSCISLAGSSWKAGFAAACSKAHHDLL